MKKILIALLLMSIFSCSNAQKIVDANTLKRDSLFNLVITAFDSVHTLLAQEPRVDSIWKLVRPLLKKSSIQEADSVTSYRRSHVSELVYNTPNEISLVVLLPGDSIMVIPADHLDSIRGAHVCGQNLIVINFREDRKFWELGYMIYHEAYHAMIDYYQHKYEDEHVVIRLLDNYIDIWTSVWADYEGKRDHDFALRISAIMDAKKETEEKY